MQSSWLTAYQTQQLIADRRDVSDTTSLQELRFAIIDSARTILPAQCQYMWDKIISEDESFKKAEFRNVPVPAWVWNLTLDTQMDWRSGIFHLSGDHAGELHYVKLVGLEFELLAVNRIWPAADALPTPTAVGTKDVDLLKTRGGAPAKVEIWHSFYLEAMKMLHGGEMEDTAKYPTQRALRDELLLRIQDQLSSDSVKPHVARIWHEFRRID